VEAEIIGSEQRESDMTIAIIGTGKMGAGIARLLASKGEKVAIGSRDPANAAKLAAEVGAGAEGGGITAAAKLADVVILAVPYTAAAETIREAGGFPGKILVDISNPITSDFKALTVGHTTSAAEEIQKLAPQAKVVKAFNTIFAQLLSAEARKGRTVQVFVAGDDAAAKKVVSDIIAKGEFDAVESGPLSNSRYLEPVGEINIHFGFFLGWGTSAAPAWIKA
jgi:NADPH-dependent F420 reductase